MKKHNFLSRVLSFVAVAVVLCSLLVLPTFADETSVYQDAYYQFCETYGIHTLERYPLDLYALDYGYDSLMGYGSAYVFGVFAEDLTWLYANSIVSPAVENSQYSYDYELEGIAGAIYKPDTDEYYAFDNAMYSIYVGGRTRVYLDITQGDFTFLRLEYSWDNVNEEYLLSNALLFEDILASDTYVYFALLVPMAQEQNEAFELLATSGIDRLSPNAFCDGYTNAPEGGAGTVVMGGMYRDIYTILKSGIYGDGAILDANQSFVLTQMSTYITYGVVLLPLLVAVLIVLRFVRA